MPTPILNDIDSDDEDWDRKYPSAGMPPQPLRAIIPENPATIETERLALRPLKPDHAEGILAVLKTLPSDPLMGTIPLTLDTVHDWIARKTFTDPPSAAGRCFEFVITKRNDETRRIIGYLGLNQVVPLANMGYCLAADVWGGGYATEAVRGLLEAWWALPRDGDGDGGGDGEVVVANAARGNRGSIGVLERCGFRCYREHRFKDGVLVGWFYLERPG